MVTVTKGGPLGFSAISVIKDVDPSAVGILKLDDFKKNIVESLSLNSDFEIGERVVVPDIFTGFSSMMVP